MAMIPKISAGKVTQVFKLPEFWAVAGAIIIAPLAAPYVTKLLAKIPFLSSHPVAGLALIGLVILLIAATMSGGIFRAIVLGVGAATVILAIFPSIQKLTGL